MKLEELVAIAQNAMKETDAGQTTVLVTGSGKVFTAVNDTEGEITETLRKEGTLKVAQMTTVWKDGTVDDAALAMKKAILSLCPENKDTVVLFGSGVKKLCDTMPG